MKKLLLAAIGGLLSTSALAGGVDHLVSEFQKVDRECNQVSDAFKVEKNISETKNSFDANACYSWAVKTGMAEQPENQKAVLMAALVASHQHASDVIEGAIGSGMAPMVAVARANEILPNHSDEIARGAIIAGVDPVVVTEATAAGKRKVENK